MIQRQEIQGMVWIDIVNPNKEDVLAAMEEFDISPMVAEELLIPTVRSRVDHYDKYLYLILHFPAMHHTQRTHNMPARNQEIDFIIGKKFLITARYEMSDPVLNFSKTIEVHAELQKTPFGDHAGFLFFHLMKRLYAALQQELQFLADALVNIEERIFDGMEKELVFELSVLSSSLLGCRTVTRPHHEVLVSLAEESVQFFGKDFSHHLESLRGEQYRVENMINGNFDTLSELRITNSALIATKEHETMKKLTLMALITFPLSLIAGLFGMNTTETPLASIPGGFWYVIALMTGVAAAFLAYFKYRKWI